jgi:hypothetical protein
MAVTKTLRVMAIALTLALIACTPLAEQARNTAAALQGAIEAAQTKYQSTCSASPTQSQCVMINQAVAGENALVTAPCVPVKGATAGLQSAISNANLFVAELRRVL